VTPRLPPGWRLDHQGEQIYRIWRVGADRPAGVVVGNYNSWTARPIGAQGNRRSWETPQMSEACRLMIEWLEENTRLHLARRRVEEADHAG